MEKSDPLPPTTMSEDGIAVTAESVTPETETNGVQLTPEYVWFWEGPASDAQGDSTYIIKSAAIHPWSYSNAHIDDTVIELKGVTGLETDDLLRMLSYTEGTGDAAITWGTAAREQFKVDFTDGNLSFRVSETNSDYFKGVIGIEKNTENGQYAFTGIVDAGGGTNPIYYDGGELDLTGLGSVSLAKGQTLRLDSFEEVQLFFGTTAEQINDDAFTFTGSGNVLLDAAALTDDDLLAFAKPGGVENTNMLNFDRLRSLASGPRATLYFGESHRITDAQAEFLLPSDLTDYENDHVASDNFLGAYVVAKGATLTADGFRAYLLHQKLMEGDGNVTIIAGGSGWVDADGKLYAGQLYSIRTTGINVIAAGAGADRINLGEVTTGSGAENVTTYTGKDILIFSQEKSGTGEAATYNSDSTVTLDTYYPDAGWDIVYIFDVKTDKLVFAESFDGLTPKLMAQAELVKGESGTLQEGGGDAVAITWKEGGRIEYNNPWASDAQKLSAILTALDEKIADTSATEYNPNQVWYYANENESYILKADGLGNATKRDHSGDMVVQLAGVDLSTALEAAEIDLLGIIGDQALVDSITPTDAA
jgi:hypothetical protein